jgi:hypothetical protein
MQFKTYSGHSFSSLPPELTPRIIYAEGALDEITPGTVVTDELGIRHRVGRMTLMCQSPRLIYQCVLVPLQQEATNV